MEDFGIRVERAALLHDIGKLVLRAHPARMNHSEAGVAFLRRYAEPQDEDILRAVGHHHASALRALSHASPSDLSYLVYEADNLAAGSDRRALEEPEQEGFSARKPLDSIFTVFGREAAGADEAPEVGAYHLQGLLEKGRPQYPQPSARVQATTAEYEDLYAYLEANFQRRSPFRMEIHELTCVLEGVLSYVPSSTALGEAADISLYDHVRLTAAYAVMLYRYLAAKGVTDYRGALFSRDSAQALRQETAGLLVSGDLSGIQSFIYTIPSAGALKSLRGRSFYLEILMENIADEILARAGMSRSSLLYTGGGHFYLLLPNTPEARAALAEARESINDWMLARLGSRLYLALAWTPFAPQEFLPGAEPGTRGVFRRVGELLAAEKLHRYSEAQLAAMFSPESDYNRTLSEGRECSICHTSSVELVPYRDEGAEACPLCEGLFRFGERILTADVFGVASEPVGEVSLPVPGIGRSLYLCALSEREAEAHADWVRLYVKNRVDTGAHLMTHLWLGDYSARTEKDGVQEFSELARRSGGSLTARGICRLGVLRADVDNLGAAFLAGFPARYATLSRTAALSRALSLFFKRYINDVCAGRLAEDGAEPFSLFGREKPRERFVHIVYSGGDDVFLVGAWDDLLELAVDLYRAFRKFTGGRLHFSAGFGMFEASFPVAEMARRTGVLEDAAKQHAGKNAIALFGAAASARTGRTKDRPAVYGWEEFIDEVCGEKLRFLQSHFSFAEGGGAGRRIVLGKSGAYRLLSLLTSAGEGIKLARFAYTLARLDPGAQAEAQPAYQEVRKEFYAWYRDARSRKQLVTALQLMIYSVREKETR